MSSINSLLSAATGGSTSAASPNSVPWSNVTANPFFQYLTIKPNNWDQLFPYRLLVIDASNANTVVNGSSTASVTVIGSNTSPIVDYTALGQQWIFTLPISPNQLSITDPFAITNTPTLRGILEEHSGSRYKIINASGTMGVWPYKASMDTAASSSSSSVIQSLFGGTIEAASNVVSQISNVIQAATTGSTLTKPTSKRPEDTSQGLSSTGWYMAQSLQQFLEQYANAKKDPANAGWRLVLDMPKQNQSFVVTPVQYVWQQNANKPLEVGYTMQFKAWRRIDLQQSVQTSTTSATPLTTGILQQILNTLSAASSAVSASMDLISAVRSDVEEPISILKQTTLLVKDMAGAITTAADLPSQVQQDYSSAIATYLVSNQNSILSQNTADAIKTAIVTLSQASSNTEGLSSAAVASGQLGSAAAAAQSINPAYNVFSDPDRNFDLINLAPIHSLTLTSAQQNTVDQIIDAARQTTVAQLKTFRGKILTLATQISNNYGAGDAYYSQVYGLAAPTTRSTPMSITEFQILKNLYDVLNSYDLLTATTAIDDRNQQSNMDFVAGLAADSGIAFNVPGSKILAPVPYGLTVEGIAQRYLGDAQRWIEITTLNNLREPYIDESGFQYSLLSNATARQITIGSIDNLSIGQTVYMISATQIASARTILGIKTLSDTSYLITLDGLANLNNYLLSDMAYLKAYLPGTVNSQQKIYIPSDLAAPTGASIIQPASTTSDPLTGISKVDWLMTDSGDIATNNYGDFRYSYGITNILQALKIKMMTEKGKVLLHPDFGLGVKVGTINSQIDVQALYNSINTQIQADPRFSGVQKLQIQLNGPVLTINLGVTITGKTGVFPVTFALT